MEDLLSETGCSKFVVSQLRELLLQGSRDKQCWEVLRVHSDDTALNDPGSTHTWELEDCTAKGPFRYLRIAQNGKNSSGQTCYISVSGFEVNLVYQLF